MNAKFLILHGVSGVGKSTLIRELINIDPKFVYISPYTNRPLRIGENDKIYKNAFEIKLLEDAGEILLTNELYGYKYATPKLKIEKAFETNNYPLLDFPIQNLDTLKKEYGGKIYSVYIMPSSINDLKHRLSDGRDNNGERYNSAIKEIKGVLSNKLDGYHYLVINKNVGHTARLIYNSFLHSLK